MKYYKVVDTCMQEGRRYFRSSEAAHSHCSSRQGCGDCGYQIGSRSANRFQVEYTSESEDRDLENGRLHFG